MVSVFAENGLSASESVLLMTTRKHIEAEGTQMFTVSSLGLAKRFATSGSKLITKTLRKQVDFYASKFESDPLVHVSIHAPEAFEQQDVVVVKGSLFKRLPLDAIKFQGSASGAGAQTFYEKDGDRVDAVYVIDKDARGEYLTREHVKFNIQDLPVLKETQRFQDVTDPTSGTAKRGTTPSPRDKNDAAVQMLADGTLEFFWGAAEAEGGVFTGVYSEVITRDLVLVYASGAAKIMPGDGLAVATRRTKIQGTKVPEEDPLVYVAYVESPYISAVYADGAVKTIQVDAISRQGKAGTGANTFNHTDQIEKITQLTNLGGLPLLTKRRSHAKAPEVSRRRGGSRRTPTPTRTLRAVRVDVAHLDLPRGPRDGDPVGFELAGLPLGDPHTHRERGLGPGGRGGGALLGRGLLGGVAQRDAFDPRPVPVPRLASPQPHRPPPLFERMY